MPDLLESKNLRRAQILANQIAPIISRVFGQSKQEEHNSHDTNDLKLAEPWVYLCAENVDNDELFASLYKQKSVRDLTPTQINDVLKFTLYALERGMITPDQIPKLNLSRVNNFDTTLLKRLVIPQLGKVHELDLSYVKSCDDDTMAVVGKNMGLLRTFIIKGTPVTDRGCVDVILGLRNPSTLSHFDASHTKITSNCLASLMERTNNSDLSILTLNGIPVTKKSIAHILKHFKKLNKISCGDNDNHVRFRDNVVVKIATPTTEIDVSDTKADTSILKNVLTIHASPKLKTLKLNASCEENLVPLIRKFASKMPELEEIQLQGDHPTIEQELHEILPHVKVLRLDIL